MTKSELATQMRSDGFIRDLVRQAAPEADGQHMLDVLRACRNRIHGLADNEVIEYFLPLDEESLESVLPSAERDDAIAEVTGAMDFLERCRSLVMFRGQGDSQFENLLAAYR